MRKLKINANAKSNGTWISIEPLYRVATQLNTLTAVGIATKKVKMEKIIAAGPLIPEVNMWCPQTKYPTKAIAILEYAIAL